MTSQLDHLVVVSPSLESGVAWLEDRLGCSVSPGGSHPRMGTHNALVKIGPREYIEVIAVDPHMERPNRDRWFGLDRIAPSSSPRLTTWVARTTSMDDAISGGLWSADSVSSMNRGSLNWKITIPSDAEWSTRSHLPLLIEWGDSRHPTDQLPDVAVRLQRLAIFDPDPDRVELLLRGTHFIPDERVVISANSVRGISAELKTPRGLVELAWT